MIVDQSANLQAVNINGACVLKCNVPLYVCDIYFMKEKLLIESI